RRLGHIVSNHNYLHTIRLVRQSHPIPSCHERPRLIRTCAPVEATRVAGDDRHGRNVASELASHDLGEAGVVALALAGHASLSDHPPARLDAHVTTLVRTDTRALDVRREADPEVATLRSSRELLRPKRHRLDHFSP